MTCNFEVVDDCFDIIDLGSTGNAYLAQSVERKTFNLVVVGSTPTVGNYFFCLRQVLRIYRKLNIFKSITYCN